MPKTLSRLIALLLVSCLAADPALAATRNAPCDATRYALRSTHYVFAEQALSGRTLWDLVSFAVHVGSQARRLGHAFSLGADHWKAVGQWFQWIPSLATPQGFDMTVPDNTDPIHQPMQMSRSRDPRHPSHGHRPPNQTVPEQDRVDPAQRLNAFLHEGSSYRVRFLTKEAEIGAVIHYAKSLAEDGRLEEAADMLKVYDRMLNPSGYHLPAAALALAHLYRRHGQVTRALEEAEMTLVYLPENAEARELKRSIVESAIDSSLTHADSQLQQTPEEKKIGPEAMSNALASLDRKHGSFSLYRKQRARLKRMLDLIVHYSPNKVMVVGQQIAFLPAALEFMGVDFVYVEPSLLMGRAYLDGHWVEESKLLKTSLDQIDLQRYGNSCEMVILLDPRAEDLGNNPWKALWDLHQIIRDGGVIVMPNYASSMPGEKLSLVQAYLQRFRNSLMPLQDKLKSEATTRAWSFFGILDRLFPTYNQAFRVTKDARVSEFPEPAAPEAKAAPAPILPAVLETLPEKHRKYQTYRLKLLSERDYHGLHRWFEDIAWLAASLWVRDHPESIDLTKLPPALAGAITEQNASKALHQLSQGKAILCYGHEVRFHPVKGQFFVSERPIQMLRPEDPPFSARPPPKVVISVLVYNGWDDTDRFLKSLCAIDVPNVEVFLLDNGSRESRLKELMEKYRDAPFRLITRRSELNLGYDEGHNVGIDYALDVAMADYVLLMNNDVEVDKGFLKKLLKIFQYGWGEIAPDQIGVIAPQSYQLRGNELTQNPWIAGGMFPRVFTLGIGWVPAPQTKQVDFVIGPALMFPHTALRTVGGLDPRFFAYFEELDMGIRLGSAGLISLIYSSAKIWYKKGASAGGVSSPFNLMLNARNLWLNFWKHHELHSPSAFLFGMILALLRAMASGLKQSFLQKSLKPLLASTRGTIAGIQRKFHDVQAGEIISHGDSKSAWRLQESS